MSKDTSSDTLLAWMGYKAARTWMQSRAFGGFVGFVVMLFALAMLTGAFIAIAMFFAAMLGWGDWNGNRHTDARNYALVVAALIGAPFIVWRAFVVQKQADIAEQGLITDRINKAVEGLGAVKEINRLGRTVRYTKDGMDYAYTEWINERKDPPDHDITADGKHKLTNDPFTNITLTEPNLEVRLGAIYALERISQDSERDHITIMEILCAYVRENAPASAAEPVEFPENGDRREIVRAIDDALKDIVVRVDIQAAIEVLGRRHTDRVAYERDETRNERGKPYVLDLRNSNLQCADFSELNFDHANFRGARLQKVILLAGTFQRVDFVGSHLQGAFASGAQFFGANFVDAQLQGVDLEGARLREVDLRDAQLEGADLKRARLQKADLGSAHLQRSYLRGARLIGADLSRAQFQDADLSEARLQLADIQLARFDNSNLRATDFTMAAARSTYFLNSENLTQDQVNSMFGDISTKLPKDLGPPDHWSAEKLEWRNIENTWLTAKDKAGLT